MQDVYKNISEYNLGQKRKILIVFDVTIADMINNKKLNPVVTELFVWGRNSNFYTLFSYENSKQKRASTNCIQSFIRYWF